MSAEPPPASAAAEELTADLAPATQPTPSKKQLKKSARKAERAAQRQQQPIQQQPPPPGAEDPFAANYGDVPVEDTQSKAVTGLSWTEVRDLDAAAAAAARSVLVRGFAQEIRSLGRMAFVVLREGRSSVQCVLAAGAGAGVSAQMVAFAKSLTRESVVDVEGVVSFPKELLVGTTQQARIVEIQVRKIYCISRAIPTLPFNLEDAARSEAEFLKPGGQQFPRVGQDTRLNYRAFEIRTPTNQAVLRISTQVQRKSENFCGQKTLMRYIPQNFSVEQAKLHKQMAIVGGCRRVFEVGPVFRAETSRTHRHLCEFTGLDVEMEIKEHYFEVCDVVDGLFVSIFKHLAEKCKEELETINSQYPFEPLKYLEQTLRLTYEEGMQMLKEAGTEIEPMGDLNTEAEKKLGRLVKEKYGTDFFILHRYPSAVRPFYTMPCYDNPAYSNSFDVFLRGEEIISGAQRIHTPGMLAKRAEERGIEASTMSAYMESFSFGAPLHGGFGAGLERVVMLLCGLDSIRMVSMFPRDAHRLSP
ncbi:aspartate--tRNA ligase 2, cytoplasmic-like [Panicum miliaceum]|uniref:aspartate--tRNA ligase n=1 Tax=Panicum miliaceum TaxID=4540 RepID=A0A3L6SQH8_PANMI|nr:aspartate--tRNA ligase 2, cytoplasmic-like [Panicum miliaceum]